MPWQRGRSYSQDLRERVLAAVGPAMQVASRFGVSASYVIKARQRRYRTGMVTTKTRGYRCLVLLSGLDDAIRAEVERHASITLAELRAWSATSRGVTVSNGTMWNTVRRLGLTLKKSRSEPPSRLDPMLRPLAVTGAGYSGG